MRSGVPEASALTQAQREGWETSPDPRGGAHLLVNSKTKLISGTLWVCRGRVYAFSEDASGGAVAFAKRVAKFSRDFGKEGLVSASSRMLSVGEISTVVVTWEDSWRSVKIEYTPSAINIAESQWVQYSVPSVCK